MSFVRPELLQLPGQLKEECSYGAVGHGHRFRASLGFKAPESTLERQKRAFGNGQERENARLLQEMGL